MCLEFGAGRAIPTLAGSESLEMGRKRALSGASCVRSPVGEAARELLRADRPGVDLDLVLRRGEPGDVDQRAGADVAAEQPVEGSASS